MQPLPAFDYLEPGSIAEAARLLADAGASSMVIGGGTDMVPSIRQGIFTPKCVVSLHNIGGLADIRWSEDAGLEIGALATLRAIETNADIAQRFPMIAEAAHAVGSPQLRQMGTVGGNICLDTRCYYYNQTDAWKSCTEGCLKTGGTLCVAVARSKKCFAVFSADLAPALIALGASITLVSARGTRSIDLAAFYTGDGLKPNVREADEILTRIVIPKAKAGYRGSYRKYRIREAIDFPIASVALALQLTGTDRICRDARLVISGAAPSPLLVKGLSALVEGKPLTDELIEQAAGLAKKVALPVANAAGERTHRRLMIFELAKQAFHRLAH